MATNKSEVVQFEFASDHFVVGRATWLAPGMVELDFQDPALRRRFARWFDEPQEDLGQIFEPHGEPTSFFRDDSSFRFADACWAMSNYYQVRRVR
ncbi:MAG: hypothetical protein ACRDJ4_00660 [Actinomycetota bacterium]